jgi:hypothetical protein
VTVTATQPVTINWHRRPRAGPGAIMSDSRADSESGGVIFKDRASDNRRRLPVTSHGDHRASGAAQSLKLRQRLPVAAGRAAHHPPAAARHRHGASLSAIAVTVSVTEY